MADRELFRIIAQAIPRSGRRLESLFPAPSPGGMPCGDALMDPLLRKA